MITTLFFLKLCNHDYNLDYNLTFFLELCNHDYKLCNRDYESFSVLITNLSFLFWKKKTFKASESCCVLRKARMFLKKIKTDVLPLLCSKLAGHLLLDARKEFK